MKSILKRITCLAVTLLIVAAMVMPGMTSVRAADDGVNNRFNVMLVVDSSGSMADTDPDNLRFDAIGQFTALLAESGNYLGAVVFSGIGGGPDSINLSMEPKLVTSQQDKNAVTDAINAIAPKGWTDTGEALSAAVDLLKKNGDPSLPSVIVFLSDGNTNLGVDDRTKESNDKKAEAIQQAREQGVAIYSVCLNANHDADTTEMAQISSATGGVFQEVVDAGDLGDVFNTFYNLIYGTSTVSLVDETIPSSGVVETKFDVPGIGVEEVNIIIYGNTTGIELFKPDGSASKPSVTELNALTMLKITDVAGGTWVLKTTGVAGDKIKINMVFNPDLDVDISLEGDSTVDSETTVTVTSSLYGSRGPATADQYAGYSAQLHVLNAYEEEIETVPMTVDGDHFAVTRTYAEGVYKFQVTVTGYELDKTTEIVGPLTVNAPVKPDDPEPEPPVVNTPPEPVEETVQKTVYIWPFKGASVEIDLNTLATDEQDDDLRYKIISSSFMEDTDYTVTDEILTISHFSLSKGAFTVRATDSGGLSCDIEIIIVTRNVGIMALIGIGVIALIVLAVFGIVLYILLNKRFMGACYVTQYDDQGNYYEEVKREKGRGRIKLSMFNLKNTGLDTSKCYIQATGKNFVYLITNKKVYGNGKLDKKFRIEGNGFDVTISTDQYSMNGIRIKFVSRLNNTNIF